MDGKTFEDTSDFNVYTVETIIQIGKDNPQTAPKIEGSLAYTLCYTSGTTGDPKGAIITHSNFLALMAGLNFSDCKYRKTDYNLSYLPLAHIYERAVYNLCAISGAKIGVFCGDKKKLLEDMAYLKPTIFASVARLYNKFFALMKAKIPEPKKGQFASMFGGRVRLMITASAPISNEVKAFFINALGVPMLEAYGQTENSGLANLTMIDDNINGHVGGICVSLEEKLVDIPDMNYLTSDVDENGKPTPRGEVCLRGFGVIPGYYMMEKKSAEAIDEHGWLHTGDVGEILPSGAIKIIDRKKNLFKLSQGEYVAPEKIENLYVKIPYIAEVFVFGDSLKDYCVGFFVADENMFPLTAKKLGFEGTIEELCENQDLMLLLWNDIYKSGKSEGLHGFEQVKQIKFLHESLADHDLLTETFKLRRHKAKLYFKEEIDILYGKEAYRFKK